MELKPTSAHQADHREVCEALAVVLREQLSVPAQAGLYLASRDAGLQPSVAFWLLALEQGPGFVSPQNFPWTLANGPAAQLAIALGIQGPNYTFVGDDSAWEAALEQAQWDCTAGLVTEALVVAIHFDDPTGWKSQLITATTTPG